MAFAEEEDFEDLEDVDDAESVEGGAEARQIVLERLEKVMRSPDVESEIRIKLFFDARSGEMPIDSFVHEIDEDLKKTAEQIVDAAEEDALKRPGLCRYGIRILGFDKRTIFELRRPKARRGEDGLPTYTPDRVGMQAGHLDLLAQLMEHNNEYARQIGSSGKREADFAFQLVRTLQEENERLKKGWFEVMRQVEELTQMSFVRRMDASRFEREEKRKEEIVEIVKSYLPLVAGGIAGVPPQLLAMMASGAGGSGAAPSAPGASVGGNGQAAGASPELRMLAEWAADFAAFEGSLSDEQQGILMQTLRPDQIMILMRMRERAKVSPPSSNAPSQEGAS